jgi:hypothetical protein
MFKRNLQIILLACNILLSGFLATPGLAQNVQADSVTFKANPFPQPPGFPNFNQHGAVGSTTVSYWVTAVYPQGESQAQGPVVVTTATTPRTSSNNIVVTWPCVHQAVSYNVLISSATPSTGSILLGNTSNCQFMDSGQSLTSWTLVTPYPPLYYLLNPPFGSLAFTNLTLSGNLTALSINDTSLTSGNCLQAGAGGLLTTTLVPCGSGAGTMTSSGGPVSGNVAAFSSSTNLVPATAANVVSLFSTCSGVLYLGADGACHALPGAGSVTQSGGTLGYLPKWGTVPNLVNSGVDEGITAASTVSVTSEGLSVVVPASGTVDSKDLLIGDSVAGAQNTWADRVESTTATCQNVAFPLLPNALCWRANGVAKMSLETSGNLNFADGSKIVPSTAGTQFKASATTSGPTQINSGGNSVSSLYLGANGVVGTAFSSASASYSLFGSQLWTATGGGGNRNPGTAATMWGMVGSSVTALGDGGFHVLTVPAGAAQSQTVSDTLDFFDVCNNGDVMVGVLNNSSSSICTVMFGVGKNEGFNVSCCFSGLSNAQVNGNFTVGTNFGVTGTVALGSSGQLTVDASGNLATSGTVSGSMALDKVTGAAAVSTATETAAGNVKTFAGVETGAAHYPYVFTNANSTNNNSSGALLVSTTGTSTGAVPMIVNQGSSSTGNAFAVVNGGSVTNGVLSGGTTLFNISAFGNAQISGALTLSNGGVNANSYTTNNTCSSAASPAVCGNNSAGSFVIAAAGTAVTVNTSAVTANSQIFVQEDESLGGKLSVTCNTGILANPPAITARVAGTSFSVGITAGLAVNPVCFSYFIVN